MCNVCAFPRPPPSDQQRDDCVVFKLSQFDVGETKEPNNGVAYVLVRKREKEELGIILVPALFCFFSFSLESWF